jgi:type VI secretion system secreted protein Hcp
MSAFDCFLQIEGIPGESQDSRHPDEIEVLSFSWGESQHAPVQSGLGAGVGQVRVLDLEVRAHASKASPKLMVACANGRQIAKARLTCCLSGLGDAEFLVITLSDVLVSGYHVAGTGGGTLPTDGFCSTSGHQDRVLRRRPDSSLTAPSRVNGTSGESRRVAPRTRRGSPAGGVVPQF